MDSLIKGGRGDRHPPYQGGIPPPIGTPLIKGGRGDQTPLIKGGRGDQTPQVIDPLNQYTYTITCLKKFQKRE